MSTAPAPLAATRRDVTSLRRWVTGAGIALIALIVGADSYEAWQDYRRVVSDNEHIMVALSRALTEQTARLVQEVDVVLAAYAGWITSAEGGAADERAVAARLNAQVVSLPFVSSATLLRANGDVRANTLDEGVRSLEGTEVFAVPAHSPGSGLYIDRPRIGPPGGGQNFAVSRRVTTPDGTLAGVLVARVAFDYLTGFYAGVNVTPDTAIRLARTDGVTLVEYPPSSAGVVRDRSRQIQASHEVGGYPIVVTVSRSRASILQPWIQEERSSAARTLTLAVLAGLLLLALRAALNRQEQMDQERHRLERELAGVQRVEALGLLAASVTHDFNNVLTAIIGYAELVRDMVEVEPAIVANVDRLLAATERARMLVRQVLTFDPRRSVSYRPIRLESILEEVMQQVQATLPASIVIRLTGVQGSTHVLGDATEIYQVVMNLCTNGVHAMQAGGTLELQLEQLDIAGQKTLVLGQVRVGRWVRLSVIDSGMGLAEEQTAAIFEPFYTTRQPNHGTGIGLTVVRNILLRMNGALEVDSRLGAGTRMTVYWPATATAVLPDALGLESRGLQAIGTGETILVVDDERELVALTEELLASLSYEPVGFSDARAALDAFRVDPSRFDAILTDERMQPLRGVDFAALIHDIDPRMPIILMTGHRDAELDARAKMAGIAEILDKPLRVQTLREALSRQLAAARLAESRSISNEMGTRDADMS
jgi:signal transduction histidine kinase/AmiR/NasT family two-component response regulator